MLPHWNDTTTHFQRHLSLYKAGTACTQWKMGNKKSTSVFSLHFVYSLHSQTQFFFYEFKIFVHVYVCQLSDLSMWSGEVDCRRVSTLSSSLHRGDVNCGSRKSSWLMSLSDCRQHVNKATFQHATIQHRFFHSLNVIHCDTKRTGPLKQVTITLSKQARCKWVFTWRIGI